MAVAFVNSTGGSGNHSASSPLSFNFTAGAGSNRCVFVTVGYNGSSGMSVTGVTFGGVAMTSAGAATHNTIDNAYAEIWYLLEASIPSGSQAVAISVSGTLGDIYGNAACFSGVDQTNPVRGGTYGNWTTASNTITSDVNDLTISAINGGGSGTSGTNQTSDGISNAGNFGFGSDHATTAAASVTHTWSGTNNPAMVGFSILVLGGAAGFIPLTGEGGLGGMRLAGSGGLAG